MRDVPGQGELDGDVQTGQKASEKTSGARLVTTKTHRESRGTQTGRDKPRAEFRATRRRLSDQVRKLFTEISKPSVNHLVEGHLVGSGFQLSQRFNDFKPGIVRRIDPE